MLNVELVTGHTHSHGAGEHGHTHEHMTSPGSYVQREKPKTRTDWKQVNLTTLFFVSNEILILTFDYICSNNREHLLLVLEGQ